jgi:hypothetical protein
MVVIDRLVPTVVEVDVLRAHRSCTAIPERQCSGVLVVVVAPGFERFVVLRNARLVASPARPATTVVVAACAIAIAIAVSVAVYQLVGYPAAVAVYQPVG